MGLIAASNFTRCTRALTMQTHPAAATAQQHVISEKGATTGWIYIEKCQGSARWTKSYSAGGQQLDYLYKRAVRAAAAKSILQLPPVLYQKRDFAWLMRGRSTCISVCGGSWNAYLHPPLSLGPNRLQRTIDGSVPPVGNYGQYFFLCAAVGQGIVPHARGTRAAHLGKSNRKLPSFAIHWCNVSVKKCVFTKKPVSCCQEWTSVAHSIIILWKLVQVQ